MLSAKKEEFYSGKGPESPWAGSDISGEFKKGLSCDRSPWWMLSPCPLVSSLARWLTKAPPPPPKQKRSKHF